MKNVLIVLTAILAGCVSREDVYFHPDTSEFEDLVRMTCPSDYPTNVFITVSNQWGRAVVSRFGAQIVSYVPAGGSEVLFMPEDRDFTKLREMHGGIPICSPWFSMNGGPMTKQHGIARYHDWKVEEFFQNAEVSRLRLSLTSDAETKKLWPYDFRLEYEIELSSRLSVRLTTFNTADPESEPGKWIDITEALHAYFRVGDIDRAAIRGFDETTTDPELSHASPVMFHGDMKLHPNIAGGYCSNWPGDYVLFDDAENRRIAISFRGNRDVWVWNSGPRENDGNLGENDYRNFICIEPANAVMEHPIRILPGRSHALSMSVKAIQRPRHPLPVARTPFAKVGKARQPVELKHFMYRGWNFGKFTDWAEYRSGDRSVMCAGDDERLKLAGGYGWGTDRRCEFGRVGVYDDKFDVRVPGKFLVCAIRLLTPGEKADDKTDTKNDRMTVDSRAKTVKWERTVGDKIYAYDLVAPADGVVELRYDAELAVTVDERIPGMRGIRVTHQPAEAGKRGLITIDLGESAFAEEAPLPMTTGIDHWANDAYDVPIQPTKNLQVNNGFEAGLRNWNNRTINNWNPEWDDEIKRCGGSNLVALSSCARSGNYALAFLPGNLDGIDGVPMGARQGQVYTVSWYQKPYDPSVKNSNGGISFSQPGGSSWTHVFDYDKNIKTVFANPEDMKPDANGWVRKAFSFKVLAGPGMRITLSGNNLLVDDIQIEEGDTVTEYVGDPVSARITSNRPYLYFRPGEKVETKLVLSGDPKHTGELEITVRNYYYETLLRKELSFALDEKGFHEEPIDLSAMIADSGMYFVQYRYRAAGREWRDHSRFQVVEPLSNDHPTKKLFANFMYNRGAQADEQMRMMMELGWGATSWMDNRDFNQGESAKLYRKYRIAPMLHAVHTELRYFRDEMAKEYPDLAAEFERSGNIRRDFGTNVNEKVCEYLRKVSYKVAMASREDDVYWAFTGEEDDLGKTPERAANYAHYQKAVYEGLKKGFDERGIRFYYAPTHGTVGGDRWAAIPVIDNYIKAGKKIGLDYDFVGVHMAWSIDEPSIASYSDRQVNHEDIKAMLRANGMDNAPFFQAETFYLLQQYIPEWDSNEWCDNYGGGIPSQSLGMREFLHGALLARTFLIDLQSWPRALASHPWQRPYTLDRELTLGIWPRIPNVLGRIFPEPKHLKHGKFNPVIRYSLFEQPDAAKRGIAKPYMDGDYAVLAVWTHDHDVERGRVKGGVLKLRLPADAKFVDLMGAERFADAPRDGFTEVPVTPAPLFILSKDTAALENAISTCVAPEYRKEGGERIWPLPQPAVKVAKCGPEGPDWTKIASPQDRPGVKFAWNDQAFFVRAETAKGDTFRIGFDGTGNARTTLLEGLGPDDQIYDFVKDEAFWTHEINTQYGHLSTGKPDAKEVKAKLERKFSPSGEGGVWELKLTERFASPVKMLEGVKFGFNCGFAASPAFPELGDPTLWMMLEFVK